MEKLKHLIKNLFYTVSPPYNKEELKEIAVNAYLKLDENVPEIKVKFAALPPEINGMVKKYNSKYEILLNPNSETIIPTLLHEVGEILIDKYWIGRSFEEKNLERLKELKDKVLQAGEEIIVNLIIKNTHINPALLENIVKQIKTKGDIISLKKFVKLCRKYGFGSYDAIKYFEQKIGGCVIHNEKQINLHQILLDFAHPYIPESLDSIIPPWELLYQTRKCNGILRAAENLLESWTHVPELREKLISNIELLKLYKSLLEEHYSLSAYREGLCEFINQTLSEEMGITVSFKQPTFGSKFYLKDTVFGRDIYDAGVNLFLRLLDKVGDRYKIIRVALESKSFEELYKKFGVEF